MNFRPRQQEEIDVNLTPLIDVVFLLLIFFMVTTTFDKNAAIKVNLPTASNVVLEDKKDKIELVIDSQGRYYIDGREVLNNKPETLFEALRYVLDEGGDGTPALVISGDGSSDFQSVITAIDIAGRLGISKVSLATSQVQRKK